ncbi:MAG TPA: OsmC family protein [Chloroflexota bacterium]|nr:OsmC family protein [Chloroflexota bacterium]
MGDWHTEIDVRGVHKFEGDESHKDGGMDAGPSPGELLLASVATCMCLAVKHIAQKRRVAIRGLSVDATGEADREAFRYGEVHLVVHAELPQEELNAIVAVAKRYCWVSNTLAGGCPVVTTAEPVVMVEADK